MPGDAVRLTARAGDRVVATRVVRGNRRATLAIPNARLWSPDDPFLYDLTAELVRVPPPGDGTPRTTPAGMTAAEAAAYAEARVIETGRDRVDSYFGMRKISTGKHPRTAKPAIFLNNKPIFQHGTLAPCRRVGLMSSLQITLVALVSVLTFWSVGAYNRLMRLRSAILSGFGPVDLQLTARHALLQRKIAALVPAQTDDTEALNALQAAATQAQAAVAHARSRPGAVGAVESLRMAEGILLQAHGRLQITAANATVNAEALKSINSELASVDVALQFARARFNDAVMEYNHAVHQFPTSLLAGLFGFRRASEL